MRIIDDPFLREKIFVFKNRKHAGLLLAKVLKEYGINNAYVFAIPSGGIPVGVVISKELDLPFDLAIVRKLHIPWNPEAGFGAVSWDGMVILNKFLVSSLNLTEDVIKECIETEKREIERRLKIFRGNRPFPDIKDKTVIITDDGLATGFTMLVALKSIRAKNPKRVITAVPTGSRRSLDLISSYTDEIICLNIRSGPLFAVANAYEKWYDLSDEDVIKLLKEVRFTDF